jgi:type IX secretion system PorP/SprF family membrane protein
MKKSLPIIVLLILGFTASLAQTDPLYAQYLMNPLLINPAYSGLTNNLNAMATYRKQWAGFDGSPSTFNATGHVSLRDNKMGLGLIVLKDEIGSNSNTEVHAAYAYKLDLQEKYLRFGLQAGLVNFRSDNGDLNIYHPEDPAFLGTVNTTKLSFGAGAIFHSDRYMISLSVPRMLKAKETFNDVETELYSQHFYLSGAYIIYLNEHIRFKPSILFRGVQGAKISTDLNFSVNIEEKFMAGVFTRNFNTYGLMAQMKLNNTARFGYTFEVPTNNSVGARFTSHEFMIGLNMAVFNFQDNIGISTF